ncbi:MAG TPA: GNAT family N-acetyltransferase, partial [Acidisphaera sp.]|nr:GNAT family N-acetyltransferase [Acidisphaera sp.]
VRSGPLVALQDRSNTIEYGYAKPVEGVEALDAAAAASAVRPLADILVACVDSGAAVSFMPPLARTDALAFWSRSAAAVARGERVIFAAWSDAEMAGTVTLDFAQQPNQPHRADIAKMMVRPCARRRGLARALMQAAEATAQARGRTLLTLDTRENDAAEPLYRSLGFIEAGRIPGYALNADGTLHATVIMYKPLGNPEAA